MHFERMTTALLCNDVGESKRFYAARLGFETVFDIGWFATLRHPSGVMLDLWHREHESVPAHLRKPTGGVVLAFLVADAGAEATRLESSGVAIVKPLTDNPWGQRNFMIEDPDGVLVDILQTTPPDPEFLRAHGLA